MYNILINNLSTLSLRFDPEKMADNKPVPDEQIINYYSYNENGDSIELTGVQTNEAVTKLLIYTLSDKQENNKLDHIISLASATVRNGKLFNKKNMMFLPAIQNYCSDSEETVKELTHFKFYETAIHNYARQQKIPAPEFDPVDIQDPQKLDPEEIHNAVIQLAKKIIQLFESHHNDCRLYMDYTGGDRTASTIMIALTKILENRNIHIQQILAVHYHPNSRENPCAIKIKNSVNEIFDFISGIYEFNQYGNAQKLISYFHVNKKEKITAQQTLLSSSETKSEHEFSQLSKEAQDVLNQITNVSDQIQMCNSSNIPESIKELYRAITDYNNSDNKDNALFDYLIQDIEVNYKNIFKNVTTSAISILSIIRWCLEKNLTQQAVTIYAELLPVEVVKQKILYYTEDNWDTEDSSCSCQRKVYLNRIQNYWNYGTYDMNKLTNNSKLRGYLNYSCEYSYINYYIWRECIPADSSGNYMLRAQNIANYVCNCPDPDSKPYILHGSDLDCKQLAWFLGNYMLFKKQVRHHMNHASNSPIDMQIIQNQMRWKNPEKIFPPLDEQNPGTMTVEILHAMLNDLLDQLYDLGMK